MIRLIFLLVFLIWNVDGVKGVKDDVSGSGSDEDEIPCCNIETIIFSTGVYPIDDVLNNVTTSNTIINISTDVVLSSTVTLEGLNNITIIGQGNPTVNCNDIGSVKFVSCNNVTIEGVIWERCGSTKLSAYPGVKFYNSSNIFIKDSSFYNSTGQAVVLSNMLGNVYINNCQFTHNKYHKGHGAAIYYTSSPEQSTQVQLVINNCNFTFNGPAESVVYVDNSNNKVNGHISLLQNSTFTQNKGVSIYISHTSLILNNSVSFKDNKATAGGGIYSSNSIIKFDDKCNVNFYNNLANTNGGAIYQEANSKMIFTMNTIAKFTRNSAVSESHVLSRVLGSGGAVFSKDSLIIFQDQSIVTFNDNKVVRVQEGFWGGAWAGAEGGVVYAINSTICTNGSSTLTFSNNNAEYEGGAVVARNDSLITFQGNSTVTFSNNSAVHAGAIYTHNYSPITFYGTSTVTFSNNNAIVGGAVYTYAYSPITFHGSSTVTFSNSNAENGGAVCTCTITFQGNSTVTFSNNNATIGGAIMLTIQIYNDKDFRYYGTSSVISFTENCTVKFINNSATDKGGALWTANYYHEPILLNVVNLSGNSTVIFSNNTAKQGGAVHFEGDYEQVIFQSSTNVMFIHNEAVEGGAVYLSSFSDIIFTDNAIVHFCNNTASLSGGAISSHDNSNISFTGGSATYFNTNLARQHGGAISSVINTRITFSETCSVVFTSNTAMQQGGVIYLLDKSSIIFLENSNVTYNANTALQGAVVYLSTWSSLTIKDDVVVDICNNTALLSGGAISSLNNSNIWFTGRSTIYFNNNLARQQGGAISSVINTRITFNETCSITFTNNTAMQQGGAIYLLDKSSIIFLESSNVTYNANTALQGAVVYLSTWSSLTIKDDVVVEICNNTASLSGGAISSLDNSNILFTGRSTIYFNDNLARQHGGAISSVINTRITFTEACSIAFTSNAAMQQGGAIYLLDKSTILFGDTSNVTYNNNTALQHGGAVYFAQQSNALFKGNSVTAFEHNKAILSGGALYSFSNYLIQFEETCKTSFYHNMVRRDGGAIQTFNTTLYFSGSSSVTFTNNAAMQQGGALNLFYKSIVIFQDDSNVTFTHNTATQHGGALYSYDHCNITIRQYSEVMFDTNSAMEYGGAMYCDHHSDVTLEGNISVTFTNNTAKNGGAVCVSQSVMKFANNSVMMLSENRAIENGGAILYTKNFTVTFYLGSSIKFYHNTANRYGGALYSEINHEGLSKLRLNTTGITFTNNRALIGDSVYLDIPTSCDEACLNRTIVGVNNETLENGPLAGHIYTPPSKLVLGDPAVCIDEDNNTKCGTYYVNNIMLGQEIIIAACVLDYYDQRTVETQFMVDSNDEDHTINGTNSVLISCTNGLQGINVTGSKISKATNYTMNLTSHDDSLSNFKTISIGLIIELSPCHPGLYYDDTAQGCVCYYDDDIITCSDSTSSLIRRGYWFGVVNNKSTVTVCPNNYCNFTCCEATNGFYELSPVRMNQCSSHRYGTACGSCEEGYTLSFDSVECVNVDQCTTGQTVMVVTLSMIYWIVIVILVFIMTYYHVGIGYLYAITYYYSMLDILLNQNLYQSKGLFTTVTTLSSLVKITPQFLGQLCLVKNMSGIDQQFIHYTHPLAVSVIIVIVCQSARISHKFSSFISRGIIRTICFLMLLSYTSVATTSLLLLRSLTFDNVDKVYTYLSPDIEYCHGRHLPYFIVAVLCTLVIVIGLPLILLLEPFLNNEINFTRIKPLLDQFQGCYKDKYRCFAAYYMICRLIIIVIIIAIPSNNDLSQFLLIFSCGVLALVVIILKPYQHKILNIFDGLILQLMVLATLIPLADNVNQQLSTATIIIVMILPLIFFIALELIVHKEAIKIITTTLTAHFKTEPVATTNDNEKTPLLGIGIIIDDNTRRNATIREM